MGETYLAYSRSQHVSKVANIFSKVFNFLIRGESLCRRVHWRLVVKNKIPIIVSSFLDNMFALNDNGSVLCYNRQLVTHSLCPGGVGMP